MQRYFVLPEQMDVNQVKIQGDDASHISKVMRMSSGDHVICSNNKGRTVRCELVEVSANEVKAAIVEELVSEVELPVDVTVVQGLPKGDKLDTIVQKGTELGAKGFIPFGSERSIVKWDAKKSSKKIERLQKIAKEAAEQSHRSFIPEVHPLMDLKDLLKTADHYNIKIVGYEEEAKQQETSRLVNTLQKTLPGQRVLCVIGPEGGLSEREASLLHENGFILCGLGPRILRTETASLYLLSAISYQFELMG